jgi:hypothetical protein
MTCRQELSGVPGTFRLVGIFRLVGTLRVPGNRL